MHVSMSLAAHRVALSARRTRGPERRAPRTIVSASEGGSSSSPGHVASSSRRVALLSSAAFAILPPTALADEGGSFLRDIQDGNLARKARLFMGPLQLTRDRLDELERTEASMNVDDLAVALGKATLDCLNPRGPLAQYAQVRDVCTLSILVKSATKGPAVVNADDSRETAAVRAAANALVTSYDELGKELASETTGGARAAAFEASRARLRDTAAALLDCFRLDDRFAGPIRSDFPDLFGA